MSQFMTLLVITGAAFRIIISVDHYVLTYSRSESAVVIFAAVTELITMAEERSSVFSTIDPVFTMLKGCLASFCNSRPTVQVMLSPPLYQARPAWYRESLPWIASQFSARFSTDRPQNLHLLPSLVSQDLCHDGATLTPVAGLHFVLHLFDQSVASLASLQASPDQQFAGLRESVRSHDDRIAYLEQDHLCLDQRIRLKSAIDAEFSDWIRNRNEEDWISITGLPRLSSDLDHREWQVEVKRQVRDLIRQILKANNARFNFEVLLVVNPLKYRKTGPTVYNVRLNSVEVSTRIRELFSGFFRHHNPVKKPPGFKGLQLRNKITLNTKIRIAILRQMGELYVESNRGGSFKVLGYQPRPCLVIQPPPTSGSGPGSSSSRREGQRRTLTFIDAISTLPHNFSDAALTQIFMTIGEHCRGELKQLFSVLNDDSHDRCLELVKAFHQARREEGRSRSGQPAAQVSSPQTFSHVASGAGAGMDTNASLLRSMRQAPPPPPPLPRDPTPKELTPVYRGKAGKTSRTKALKRSRASSSSSSTSGKHQSKARKKRSRRSRSRSSSSSSSSSSAASNSSSSSSSSESSESESEADSRKKRSKPKPKSRQPSKNHKK